VTSTLQDNELLRGFKPDWVTWFEEHSIEVSFSRGDLVIERGHAAIGLYLIRDGEVSVRTDRGAEIAKVRMGSVIGEMALVDGGTRSVNVVAVTDVASILMTTHQFDAIKVQRPEIALAIMTNLCRIMSSRVRGMQRLLS